jgi:alkylmercury lyase
MTADLPAPARRLRIVAFRELFEGRAPTLAQLAARLGLDEAQAAEVLDRLAERGLVVVEGQRVIGSLGLSLRSTRHRVELADRVLHTWCAYDAVGLPAALGRDATTVTSCPQCRRVLRLELASGQPPPGSAVVGWWPDRSSCTNVVGQFCPYANLFCDHGHLARWRAAAGQPAGEILDLGELARRGRDNWGPALRGPLRA